MAESISFNESKLKEFKKVYNKAKSEKLESFTFEDHEILVSYAKYMIEYLETIF